MFQQKDQDFYTEIKLVLLFGLFSALSAHLNFSIPEAGGVQTDPREIVALTSVFFLSNWRSALAVGILATLGGPYNSSIFINLLIHAAAIPAAWLAFQIIDRRVKNHFFLALTWGIQVVFLYMIIYIPFYIVYALWTGQITVSAGFTFYVNYLNGAVLEILATSIITALVLMIKVSRENLLEGNQRQRFIIESIQLGLWGWNLATDRLDLNKQWRKLLGIVREGQPLTMVAFKKRIHPDDVAELDLRIRGLLRGENPEVSAEFRIRDHRRQWRSVFLSGKIVEWDRRQNPLRAIGILLDVTTRKQLEEENIRLQQQLIQAQKMESIGTLAGGIAHDFNNILTVINGNADLALTTLRGGDEIKKYLLAIRSAGERAAQLTAQLLAFSRKQVYSPQAINLNDVIRKMESMLRRLIGGDIRIELKLARNLPGIKADPVQVEQILLNLVVNARDAINDRKKGSFEKTISIETKKMNLGDSYVASHLDSVRGAYVMMSVSDNGVGMDKKIQEKIFEPFFTTKEKGRGTGMGLSTVYGIVKQNKGIINVYSEKGSGTIFKIYWPSTNHLAKAEQKSPAKPVMALGTETILYVEDDDDVREFTSIALQSFGYSVIEARTGMEALHLILENKIKPDLVITDLIMPKLNGKDLALKVKKEFPHCPIIFTSGYTDSHLARDGALDSDVTFVHKPYSIQKLTVIVREVLDRPPK